MELPRPDIYTVSNGYEQLRINTGSRRHRRQYQNEFEKRLEATREAFARIRVPLLELTTSEPVTESVPARYNAYSAQAK